MWIFFKKDGATEDDETVELGDGKLFVTGDKMAFV
jgi:hypothetical protein